jgi:predicted nucleic acid-binding protein
LAQAVADTNLLVAVMVEDDRNHKQAIRIWESFEKFLVPTMALFELSFFLARNKLGLELLDQIVTDPKIEYVENNLDDFSYLVRHSDKVRHYDDVGDLIIISVAKRLGVELKTFDKDLAKLVS